MATGTGESFFQELLRKAAEVRASDIHIKTGLPPVVRLLDSLRLLSRSLPAVTAEQVLSICREIINPSLRPSFEAGKEIDMAYSLPGVGRFRLNIFRHRGQLGIICRVIPFEVKSLQELGMPEALKNLAVTTRGLILITGNVGSGKSSTLAAMLNEWNTTRGGHIVTIEDPVEFLIRDRKSVITQREVGLDTDSFTSGLKHALRQNPDVIMIGELRDRESVQTALNAAETGHLVLSTLHTRDAGETVSRLVGIFEPEVQQQIRVQLAAVLTAVISQRLLPRAPDSQGRILGLLPACEILVNTPRVRDCLLNPDRFASIHDAMEEGANYGMQSFDQSLMEHLQEGLITPETAISNATSPGDFELRLRGVQSSSQSWSGRGGA